MAAYDALRRALSAERLSTYERIASTCGPDVTAESLYVWNMRMCGALMMPVHLCEVVTRNAAASALARQHGPRWPWNDAFRRRLPASSSTSARAALEQVASRATDTPRIVADLPMVFWQQLFTCRFDATLWIPALGTVLRHAPAAHPSVIRKAIHADIGRIRHLRNRIVHHEPILERDLGADLAAIGRLIHARCPHTLEWLQRHERATTALAASPLGARA
ncbi:hypothetical protein N5C18_08020 [Stenotrophomonas sp. GD03930]|uniref:hypothetical protein n=1 Tax=Stenotrophomonas sp. GD03930 TaxID=2975406 RepID=UPI00244CC123|nr:hypothetical protein [Stenotrophomonas sp. GD03930]KAG0778106.1 hypothetical protein G6F22_011432 [Rhizopus arrhizus]KAG1261081.1 hypothetical protein G6F65_014941 [Rhizopus arrhizus]MDH1231531.1 hypothetical protein [Stenotrophomonas sp. GD03930]HEL4299736.1 hypothetical protein [Stenotrophomonas maltophilia]